MAIPGISDLLGKVARVAQVHEEHLHRLQGFLLTSRKTKRQVLSCDARKNEFVFRLPRWKHREQHNVRFVVDRDFENIGRVVCARWAGGVGLTLGFLGLNFYENLGFIKQMQLLSIKQWI